MKGSFEVNILQESKEIEFVALGEAVPKEQADFMIAVSDTIHYIQMLFKENEKQLNIHFEQLAGIADLGLRFDEKQDVHPEIAKQALEQFKIEVVRKESGRIKNQYMKKLGIKALYGSLAALLVYYLINLNHAYLAPEVKTIMPLLLIWVGTMMGVWLSYGMRKKIMNFKDLVIMEDDRLEPMVRLLFIGLISQVFGLLFITNVVNIDFGAFKTSNLQSSEVLSLLTGIFLGLSEQTIGLKLTNNVSAFLEKI